MKLSDWRNSLFIADLLVVALLIVGLSWAVLSLFAGPNVRKVEPSVLSEMRDVGQVIGEDTDIGHQWENDYAESKHLVVYLNPGTENDVVAETEQRLRQAGWHVQSREPPEIHLRSAKWPGHYMVVEHLDGTDLLHDSLHNAVRASDLPLSRMAYIVVHR
ncbi:hypothetical protein AB0J42_00680 [Nonomuraea sp. NPDC049649]|uniref:hypothetical protein n=1 Tax=Nonomuraea sp. NPDC049649 TaxID=3155776 RepID=UPI00341E2C06